MIDDAILMMVILNPFGQVVYMSELMNEVSFKDFRKIFLYASVMTFFACLVFALTGDFLLKDVFHVQLPAIRIFGGVIIFYVAFSYIMKGPEGVRLFRGDITDVAQQITLPLLVGPGLIWIAIKIGRSHPVHISSLIIGSVLFANLFLVYLYHYFFKKAKGKVEMTIIKYFGILMRINALMLGAVSIELVLDGLLNFIKQF